MILVLILTFTFLLGFLVGGRFTHWYIEHLDSKERLKTTTETEGIFNEVLSSIGTKFVSFHTRLNENLIFKVNLVSVGVVDMVLNMNKSDLIIIFPNKTYSSYYISDKIRLDIIDNLKYYYSVEYDDCITFNGNVIDKKTISRITGNLVDKSISESVIDPLFSKKVENDLDIDDILDKINRVGIDNLTIEEKKFLNSYGKNE